MARKKMLDEEKKIKTGITINTELLNLFEEHIKDINVNRSKYIESLIKKDIIKRGIQLKNKFEK